ncbi:MAG: hypothetical protein M3171_04465 [Actinomycetota bacterium]|nr:hypothetical protein [Actinomycetota bacterium]
MTEATPPPTAPQPADPPVDPPATLTNVTALVGEAMTKSGVIWVEIPGDRAWPVWHAWVAPTAYVVNGPGEQHLPWLPEEVVVVLRSQDSGGRLLRVKARTRVLTATDPDSSGWVTAVTALQAGRLNAVDDVVERWRTQCAVTALTPFGNPVEGPGHYLDGSGAAAPAPSRATTVRWRPWHLGGRPKRRRGTR